MKNYKKPQSFSNNITSSKKPISVGAAFANGFAKGMKASVFGAREISKLSESKLSPVKKVAFA